MLLVILVASVACWGSPSFKLIVENQTEYTLTIYVNDYKMGNVSPGTQISDSPFGIDTGAFHIKAKNTKGEIVFSETYTFKSKDKYRLIEIDEKHKGVTKVYKAVIPPLENK
jgi:hypothetical protein